MNRWHLTREHRRVVTLLGTLGPLSPRQIACALDKPLGLVWGLLTNLRLGHLITRTDLHGVRAAGTIGRFAADMRPSARAQLYLRGQWLTRPTRHLIALSELVDGTFRDREAFMLNHPQPAPSIEAAA